MTVAVTFEFPNGSLDDYRKVFEIGGPAITDQPERTFHVCWETEHGFTVLDVWASEEAFARFGPVIGPVMSQLGLQTTPQVHPVRRTVDAAGHLEDH